MKRKRSPERIGNVVESVLAQRGYLNACREHEAMQAWTEIAGEAIAAVTQCDRVEGGKLHVRVSSAAWRQELSYLKQHLLASIREKSRCRTICDIIFF